MRAFAPAILLLALASVPVLAETPERQITVTGEAEMRAAPDIARLTAGVVSEAETAGEAVEANNRDTGAMLAALREAGIESRDLQTANFSVEPRYANLREGNAAPRIEGYAARNTVSVTVRDLDSVGETLDAIVTAGANEISGLAFDIEDKRALADRARADAVADARRKAQVYADAAGVELGEVVSIEERAHEFPRPVAYRAMAMEARDSSVPVEAGEQTVRVQVGVVWSLAGDSDDAHEPDAGGRP